jgi:hypothetical protein
LRHLLITLACLCLTFGVSCGDDDDDGSNSDPNGGPAATTASGSSSAGGATLQDACTLLSEEQVNAALGDDTVASTNNEPPTEATALCQWQGSQTGNRYLYLTLLAAQNGMTIFESNYHNAADALDIEGVGDEAVALIGGDTGNNYRFLTAAALTSRVYIQVNIAGPSRSDDESLAVLRTVLEQILANLQ